MKKNPKNRNQAAEREEEEPLVQESRDGDDGGFAFLFALAGHTEVEPNHPMGYHPTPQAISGISLPAGSDNH
ncbi:hypothetical protein E2562_037392 [Oryza meyeriana var. granulata]|uniref:Uncharacterized protein n=1 Tax=Oryza meyeriana var. granulata TaxID=110450 RepID=A0A6G1DAX9_9ORYZ|nr:hypothetical protein E2562_037392 [Oryza meyeriana var. granulata]